MSSSLGYRDMATIMTNDDISTKNVHARVPNPFSPHA